MLKHLLAIAVFNMPLISSFSQSITSGQLKQEIGSRIQELTGRYAVAFRDLQTGEQILINEQENFHAASTMKTPVLIEVYKQVKKKKLSLSDSILIKNEFKSIVDGSAYSLKVEDDSEQKLYSLVGTRRTLAELAYDMIIYSSNLATNLVIELVDAKKVMKTMKQLGAKKIQVLRGVEDSKAYEKGINNTTTAYDLMLIFDKIARGKVVSPAASKDMIRILLDQQFNSIIPAKLPAGVKVAHKTGNITGVLHDSGIVFLPDGRKYVLVLLSKNIGSEETAKAAMADISEMIYGYVERKKE